MVCQKCSNTETVDMFTTYGKLVWRLCDDCANEYHAYVDDLNNEDLILVKAMEMQIVNTMEPIPLDVCKKFFVLDRLLRMKFRKIDKDWLNKAENY